MDNTSSRGTMRMVKLHHLSEIFLSNVNFVYLRRDNGMLASQERGLHQMEPMSCGSISLWLDVDRSVRSVIRRYYKKLILVTSTETIEHSDFSWNGGLMGDREGKKLTIGTPSLRGRRSWTRRRLATLQRTLRRPVSQRGMSTLRVMLHSTRNRPIRS